MEDPATEIGQRRIDLYRRRIGRLACARAVRPLEKHINALSPFLERLDRVW